MKKIVLNPIGIINTPFKDQKDIPIQGCFDKIPKGVCEVSDKYIDGLIDLQEFSHAILIYYFHKVKEEKIKAKPYLESVEHGVFAIRSPYRPNKIGISIVKIEKIVDNKLFFSEVDMLDGTPLIDIKPFVKHFDNRNNVKSGWIDKHFENGNIPEQTILR